MRVGRTERFNIFDLTRDEITWLHGVVDQEIKRMSHIDEMREFAQDLESKIYGQMEWEEA